MLEAARPLAEPAPRLCEAGPCRHYHRFSIQLDAQDPLAERKDGKLIQHARVFHATTNHYCYPEVGIESNLGSLSVLECNRWAPIKGLLTMTRTVKARYQRELAAWHDEREREADELNAAVAGPSLAIAVHDVEWMAHLASVDPGMSLRNLILCAGDVAARPLDVDSVQGVTDESGDLITNLDATVAELGLATGAKLTLKFKETA